MQNSLYYTYTIYDLIWFCWVGFYGISTIVGYLMPNPLNTYIVNIYDLLTHFIDNILKRFKYFYQIQIILFTINPLFATSEVDTIIAI